MTVKKYWHPLLSSDVIKLFATRKCQEIPKKMMKLANIDKENLHIFRTTCEISIEFSGKILVSWCYQNSLKNKGLQSI